MSNYNRKDLAHTKKVIPSSIGSPEPCYSLDAVSAKETKKKLSENLFMAGHASSILTVQGLTSHTAANLGSSEDNCDIKKIPMVSVSVSKPSAAINRLLTKRKNDHEKALRDMRNELTASYAACEKEFRNRSISTKIQIDNICAELNRVTDQLMNINILDLGPKDYNVAWKKISEIIENEKQFVDNFYKNILKIEKKRQEYSKSIFQKYYKVFHKISFLLPYEIQVYLENEILNYNYAVLGNHRIYADLHLQMNLITDAKKLRLKNWIEELKIDNQVAMEFNN